MMKIEACLTFLGLFATGCLAADVQDCVANPATDMDHVLEDGQSISLSCNYPDNETVVMCVWQHKFPMNEGHHLPDIQCWAGPELNGRQCENDTRITYNTSSNMCGIEVQNTNPEDSGKWSSHAVVQASNGELSVRQSSFEMVTYNRSTVVINDGLTSLDTFLGQVVQMPCLASGGRPFPDFQWYIDNNDSDDLSQNSHFQINERIIGSEDKGGYIVNIVSEIDFAVDQDLLDILKGYGYDTDPDIGIISFELTCGVHQQLLYFTKEPVRINILV